MRVLFLDLDTLRPDHLGCYGYHRNTSPNIDKIADKSVLFDNYYCSDAPCLPSRAALMSGRFGIHNGAVGHGGTAADMLLDTNKRHFRNRMEEECLPHIFRQAGMHTCTISPFAERHSAMWFLQGFNEMHNTGWGGHESAETITPVVLKWIEDNAEKDDWFLHVNYWDAHTPYRAPAKFGNPFKDEPLPDFPSEDVIKEQVEKQIGPHGCHEIGMYTSNEDPNYPRQPGEIHDMDGVRKMIDGYDCGIAYMDSHIGKLIDAFTEKGVADDLMIIISADHAENMGELGIWGEHATADYINCRIPMIIKYPGGKQGHIDTGLHHNLDLSPTLAELFKVEKQERWDGESYAPAILKGEECGKDYAVISQMAHVCQRGVRFDDWMYIRTYHDGYHLFDKEMLFNIKDDPHETDNLAGKRKDICMEGAYKLMEWHDDMMASMAEENPTDPLWTVMHENGPFHAGFTNPLPEYCKRLEETGRGWAVPELKKRHPREFKK